MDMKEKLVEILRKPIFPHELVDPIEAVADYLLDSGVTVQEWISVKDRLPESGKQALCFTKRGEFWVAAWDDVGDHLWSDGEIWCSNGCVTHWMPLPQPPKGE